jgi:uncharacterized membrane protein YsdA (DUF1294 family)
LSGSFLSSRIGIPTNGLLVALILKIGLQKQKSSMNYTAELESYLLRYLSNVKLPWLLFGGYLIFAGLFGFFVLGVDKYRAAHGGWRISEFFLLKVAFAGGCVGVLVGTQAFHHKYEKDIFMGLLFGALVALFFIFQGMIHLFGTP